MLVNGKNVHPDELIEDLNIKQNFLQKINDNISLTEHQINILKQNHINYEVGSLKELIFIISEVIDEDENEDLEIILKEIAERDYYENTKK